MATARTNGVDHTQQHRKGNTLQPQSHASDIHSANASDPVNADSDYLPFDEDPFDEDDSPMTPSAANVAVEETPESRRVRLELEETMFRNKTSQVPTTSTRFQLSFMQDDVLEDPNFSFMPAHQQFTSMQHVNGRSTTRALPSVEETGDGEQESSSSARPHRSLEIRSVPEVDLVSVQYKGETPNENGGRMDDEALAPQHESFVVHSEPQQQEQYEELVPRARDQASHNGEHHTVGDGEDHKHDGSYDGQVDAIAATNDVQPNQTDLIDASCAQTSRYANPDDGNNEAVVDFMHSSPNKKHTSNNHISQLPSHTGAGGAPIHHARISKAPRRRHPHPAGNPRVQRCANGKLMQQPSEEDLLFLLMSRARDNGQVRKRLEHLELENRNLQEEKEQSGAELQHAVDARNECVQEYNLLTQGLQKFKEKYYKLKKWALETNKDCEELQQTTAGFRRALSDLTKDRNQMLAQLQDAQSTSETASEKMANVQSEIREVKLIAEERLASINQLNGLLTSQDDKLLAEARLRKKLELHIAYLEQERSQHNHRMHGDQQELNQALQTMSGKLQSLQNESAEAKSGKGLLIALLSRIQATMDNDLSTKSDISSLAADFGFASDSFDEAKTSICEKLEQEIGELKDTLQKNVSTHEEKLLSAVQSENGQFLEVKAALSGLEQKTGNTGEMVKLLQDTKTAAEKNLRVIADNLTKVLGPEREAARKKVDTLETQIGEIRTKWQRACTDRETCKQERELEKIAHQAETGRIREEGRMEGRLLGKEEGRKEGREQGRQEGRQERDAKRDAEHQAEVVDLLAFLSEAMQEHNCFQSELSKAEELLHQTEKQKKQAQEQEDFETAERSHRIECQFRDLQHDIDHGLEQRAKARGEIESLKVIVLQLRRDLEASRGETIIAIREQYALHDEIVDLERRLDWAGKNLEQTTRHLQAVTDELEVFYLEQPGVEQLKKDLLSQEQKVESKSQDVQTLRNEADQYQSRCAQLEEQVREKDALTEENKALETQLKVAKKDAQVMSGLQNELVRKKTEIEELKTALAASQQEAQEKDKLAQENAAITKRLTELEKRHSVIPELQKRVQQKNTKITELEGALETSQRQREDERATMQQQILSLEGALSNAKLDRDAIQLQPQRRAADRSGRAHVSQNNQLAHLDMDANRRAISLSNGDTLASSAHTTVVPETQPEVPESVPVDHDSLAPLPGQQPENSESELSPIPSEDEGGGFEGEIGGDITNSQHYSRGQGYVSPTVKALNRASHGQLPFERPPSSSYSSQGEQMLLDQVSQGNPHSAEDIGTAGTNPDIMMPWNKLVSTEISSPRRLRSGSQGRRDAATPEPSTQSGRNRASTPAIRREQYQPNSAAKRRIDPEAEDTVSEENIKKLKRRPANMEVKVPQLRTLMQSSQQAPSRGPSSWRKSSTVVGTNAPAPGRSQRISKGARKGSRQDRYSSRFSSEA